MRTVVLPPAAHVLCVVAAFLSTTVVALLSAAEGDSLAAEQSIKHNESLVSGKGSFRLGFFTSRPNHTYLGIWYNQIPDRTVVWVANRLRPLPEYSTGTSLLLSRNGILVLADAAGTVYWSSDPPANLSNRPVQARLLEDGNLVVVSGSGNDPGSYAWESFAEPTDTLLQGMKLGVNRRTGKSYNLTAWKATDDPSPGDYSLVISDRGVPQLFLVNGTVPLWRGGFWVDERDTKGPLTRSGLFDYGFTSSSDEIYYMFYRWNASVMTRITVFPWGVAKHLRWYDGGRKWESIWEADDDCDRFDLCGANAVCEAKTSGPVCSCLEGFHTPQPPPGQPAAVCERTRHLSYCPGGEDEFVRVSGVKLPDASRATRSGLGFDECRAACLGNCSCTAFSGVADGSGCFTWFGNLTDLRLYSGLGQDLYVRVAASDGRIKSGKGVIIIIIVVVLITFVAVMLGLLLCLWRRRRMARTMLSDPRLPLQERGEKEQR